MISGRACLLLKPQKGFLLSCEHIEKEDKNSEVKHKDPEVEGGPGSSGGSGFTCVRLTGGTAFRSPAVTNFVIVLFSDSSPGVGTVEARGRSGSAFLLSGEAEGANRLREESSCRLPLETLRPTRHLFEKTNRERPGGSQQPQDGDERREIPRSAF